MKHLIMAISTFFMFNTLLFADVEKGENIMTKTIIKDEVKLALSLQDKCIAGKSSYCDISLTNNKKAAITYGHVSEYKDFLINVHNSDGETIPLTRFGKIVIGGEIGEHKKYNAKDLLSGQILSHRYNLSRLFDLTISDIYTITVKREVNENQPGKQIVLEIKDFEFKVSDP